MQSAIFFLSRCRSLADQPSQKQLSQSGVLLIPAANPHISGMGQYSSGECRSVLLKTSAANTDIWGYTKPFPTLGASLV